MKSQITSVGKINPVIPKDEHGFTLIEMLLVIGLIILIGKFSLSFDFNMHRGHSFYSERGLLISLLSHARSEAMNSICKGELCSSGSSHGVHVDSNFYTVFQGEDFPTRIVEYDETFESNPNINKIGLTDIVFTKERGSTQNVGSITITDLSDGKTSTVTINSEGQISWTN